MIRICRTRITWALIASLASLTAIGIREITAQTTTGDPGSPDATTTVDGNYLPNPPARFGGTIGLSAADSTPYWPPNIVPPKGAPNILLIMTDDAGYGVSSTFGGVIPTPTMDRIANMGLRFTQFHSTALCSPTRAALITGRNHHSVGFGVISEQATGFPGYDSVIGIENATIGEILKQNGYATSWFGKNHNTPTYQISTAGPFDQWPSGMGFEYFYGFMGGETDQWTPWLFHNHTQIFPWREKPGYNLITGMADDAINYLHELDAAAPDKPFFVYYVPGGTHAPHQPTEEWIKKFKGKFDMGWNELRQQIFANQIKQGVVPEGTQLPPWPNGQEEYSGAKLPEWNTLSADEKKLFARQAEVFAAYVAYTDHEIGRVIQAVDDMGKLDNTLVIYVTGDNGTSAEGSTVGTPFDLAAIQGINVPIEEQLKFYDQWGGPMTQPHMSVAWSWAFDTPFKWTKQVASYFGGTRQGMVIAWPNHIKDAGGIRHQFHHVIDIVPTILEVTGIPAPSMVNGVAQKPIEGVSMTYTFDEKNAKAPTKRTTQYFEMMGNRALYHEGWMACTRPPQPPWLMGLAKMPEVVNGYTWELYNIDQDFSQSNDLATQHPDKLRELQELFFVEGEKYQVFPLDNDVLGRLLAARPSYIAGRKAFTYNNLVSGIPAGSSPNILAKSYTIAAEIDVPAADASGMIVTEGGRFGGYGLYLLKGKPVFTYNLLSLRRNRWEGPPLSPGQHTIEFDFEYDGGGFGKGGTGTLTVDGKRGEPQKLPNTIPVLLTIDESFDVGVDTRSPVDDNDYQVPFKFNGTVHKVTVALDPPRKNPADE
jgi:arylsulfatase